MALHWKIIIGLVLGIIWALVSSNFGWNQFTTDWISPFGDIFIRLLKLIAIPLVLFSIISGITGLNDIGRLGKIGAKTIITYVITTMVAVSIGLIIVNAIQPGKAVAEQDRLKNRIRYELWVQNTDEVDKLDDINELSNPENQKLVQEVSKEEASKEVDEKLQDLEKKKSSTEDQGPLQQLVEIVPVNIVLSLQDGGLMLQIIFFAIFFGVTLLMINKDRAKPVIDFMHGCNDVFVKMVDIIMKWAPFFVFCLMAGVMSKMADTPQEVIEIFKGLGVYGLTVVLGLAFMVFVFYPGLLSVLVRGVKYRKFFKHMSPAQFLAFSTSSSAATLPVTMECVEDGVGVSKNISSFVLPIGATVNMDGTSLYQAVGVIFLAQLHGVDLTLMQQMTIILTATLASIGSAAVPSAGLVMLMIVLQSVGLNPEWIAIIFPIDRILDMCRTVVNVTGDASVATFIASTEGELKPQTDE